MILKRLLTLAFIGIVISFSLLAYLFADRQSILLEKSAEEKARLYTDSLHTAIKESMLAGNLNITRGIVDKLNQQKAGKISVYRSNGSLAFGPGGLEIPQRAFAEPQDIVLRPKDSLLVIHPLANEPQCHRCHREKNAILGVVTVTIPTAYINSSISDLQRRLIFFGILLIFSAAAAVFFFAKKIMLDPINRLLEGVEIIRKGNLGHRIALNSKDELGSLSTAFNQMTEEMEKAHSKLEHAVRQKTNELRVIADLSTEVFRGDITLSVIVEKFLDGIINGMDYGYSVLCLIDKDTGTLYREFKKGVDGSFCAAEIALAGSHPFAKAVIEARPLIRKAEDLGATALCPNVVIIPILSHSRKRCREINLCNHEACPAFNKPDERCWTTANTLCRSPQAAAGSEKIYGCLHCSVFPVLGVLVAGRSGNIHKSSLHSLEILASEIASAIEAQMLIESQKKDIKKLVELHDISVESLQNPGGPLTEAIVASIASFSNIEAAILWMRGEDGALYREASSNIDVDSAPKVVPADDPFTGRAVAEKRAIETLEMNHTGMLGGIVDRHGFLYAAAIPLVYKGRILGCLTVFKKKDFQMTDPEKAVVRLFTSQAAAALNTAAVYDELRDSEEHYRSLFENALDIIFIVSREGAVVSLNPAFEKMTGLHAADWIGRPFGRLVHPDDLPFAEAVFRHVLSDESPPVFELRIKSGPEGYMVGEITVSPYVSAGKVTGILGVVRNITERKMAEENLKRVMLELGKQKDLSDSIFNNTSSGMLVLDNEGIVIGINKSGLDILGFSSDTLTGKQIVAINPEFNSMRIVEDKPDRVIEITTPDGLVRPVGFSNSFLRDDGSGINGTIVVFRDLTEIRKIQTETRKKDHIDTMTKVISGVAHEIRNPLFGISAIGQIIERETDQPQHRTLMQALLKEANRMKRLVEELLLYTRVSRLDIQETDLRILLEEVVHFTRAKRKDVVLIIKADPSIMARVDRDKIQQVFLNILDNAAEAAAGLISITAGNNGGFAEIEVTDDGPGIKAEDISRVFDPFFTTKKGGTGLGLPICRKIVEDHGGTIRIDGVAEKGTAVTVRLRN